MQTVRESLGKYEALAEERAHEAGEEVSWIVLDLSPVPEIDATAVHYWCACCNCTIHAEQRLWA